MSAAEYDLEEVIPALANVFNGVETGDEIGGVAVTISCLPEVPGEVEPPAIILEMDDQEWDLNMGAGADSFTVLALVLVQYQDMATAQRELWRFLSRKPSAGISRLKAALEADQTLGGLVSYAVMTRVRTIGTTTYGNVDYLGAEIVIEVMS
jgi:hypothetical protein